MTWQELFNAQGVPMFKEALEATGVGAPPIPLDIGRSNGVKLAGNGFHIACAGSFVGFILTFLKKKPEPATPVVPVTDVQDGPPTLASICPKTAN